MTFFDDYTSTYNLKREMEAMFAEYKAITAE
jgi:hypothetical protein